VSDRKPLLEMSTLAPERPFVTIDDEPFDLRLLNEFGAAEHADYSRDTRAYDELWNAKTRTAADNRRMEKLLDALFDRSLVDAKACREKVGDRLTAPVKREIVLTFTTAPLLMKAMAQMEEDEKKAKAEDSSITES